MMREPLLPRNWIKLRTLYDQKLTGVGFIIPANHARDLERSRSPRCSFIVDGFDPTVARTAMNTARILAQRRGMEMEAGYLAQRGVSPNSVPGIDFRPQVWFNPELDSVKFNIHSVS